MRNNRLRNIGVAFGAFSAILLTLAAAIGARANDRQTEAFHQTYTLAPNGQVSLANVNGSVHITGWDQNEVKVDAVKTVWSGTSLNDVKIEVDHQPDSIHIETKTAHHWFGNSHWQVDYTVMVPRHARLDKVELVNGGINIEDVAGDVNASSVNGRINTVSLSGGVQLSAVNGAIRATYNTPDLSRPVSLKTVNGAISLSLPPDTNANVSARTLNGGISCDFPIKINAGYVGRRVEGALGKGGTDVNLKTVNGSITIHRGSSEAN